MNEEERGGEVEDEVGVGGHLFLATEATVEGLEGVKDCASCDSLDDC